MGNAKAEKEELKNLEDKAYFELCQIIAEAMQVQDIELLDYRIASWKNKYKKLLDNPSPNFKKRIEYLLTEYYSSVTQYIQSQIKFNENKKIENQSKALRELYVIIRDTNDLKTLEKKVNSWKEKYPKDKFLKMYQSKYEHMTSQKNLKENAFDQGIAFKDLVDITKHTGTFEEFVKEREEWEKKYSIHNKFELDDFIKHQSEIKRYTSDEYLHSISRDPETEKQNNNSTTDLPEQSKPEEVTNKMYSDLSKQAAAYASLVAISSKPNNVNEMFKWVYKNSSIKFNDKYKELILNATYLDYSPTYLNKLEIPNLNVNNKSLSYEEFNEMNDIKKYAIISYFNLLLPPDKAISNNFFNSCISTVYTKSEEARLSNSALNELKQKDLKNGIEIKLSKPDAEQELNLPELKEQEIPDIDKTEFLSSETEKQKSKQANSAQKLQEDLHTNLKEEKKEEIIVAVSPVLNDLAKEKTQTDESALPKIEEKKEISEPNKEKFPEPVKTMLHSKEEKKSYIRKEPLENVTSIFAEPTLESSFEKSETEVKEDIDTPIQATEAVEENPLSQEDIITISPLLFSVINYKAKQAEAVEKIDEHVDDYVLSVSKSNSDYIQTNTKQKID